MTLSITLESGRLNRRGLLCSAIAIGAIAAARSTSAAAYPASKEIVAMTERLITVGPVEIATEAFGDPSDAPILLIMGTMASMLWWPERFCRRLAAEGCYVIRYDNRDTGLSTVYAPGDPPYSMDDLAADAIGVLDAYGLDRAHLVGMSMGGSVAQIAALAHPARVATVTLISSTPLGGGDASLPGSPDAYMAHAAEGESVDWSDNAQVIAYIVKDTRMIAGSAFPYDETQARALVERDVRRARNFVSATNHFMLEGGEAWAGRLAELKAPLLVIHGAVDPIYPIEHGESLARIVDGARLVRLEGGGHEIHPEHWSVVAGVIGEHVRA